MLGRRCWTHRGAIRTHSCALGRARPARQNTTLRRQNTSFAPHVGPRGPVGTRKHVLKLWLALSDHPICARLAFENTSFSVVSRSKKPRLRPFRDRKHLVFARLALENTLFRARFALEKTSFAPVLRSKKHRFRAFCARKTSFAPANPLLRTVCARLALEKTARRHRKPHSRPQIWTTWIFQGQVADSLRIPFPCQADKGRQQSREKTLVSPNIRIE